MTAENLGLEPRRHILTTSERKSR